MTLQLLVFDGIEIQVEDEVWELKGRGWVYVAKIIKLPDEYTDSCVLGVKIRQQKLKNQDIIGVEMFATVSQHEGRNVGLLVKEKI